jgi:hypothetical protein|tara:strand:- start:78 stop:497 length:420 start_codon:yes stop_codon:yes gene_type:complete
VTSNSYADTSDLNEQGQVKFVRKDQVVPFDGMLLSIEAAIKNKVLIETQNERFEIKLKYEKDLLSSQYIADLAKKQVIFDSQIEKKNLELNLQVRQIDFLKDNYKQFDTIWGFELGLVFGAVGMLGLTLATAYSLNLVK